MSCGMCGTIFLLGTDWAQVMFARLLLLLVLPTDARRSLAEVSPGIEVSWNMMEHDGTIPWKHTMEPYHGTIWKPFLSQVIHERSCWPCTPIPQGVRAGHSGRTILLEIEDDMLNMS